MAAAMGRRTTKAMVAEEAATSKRRHSTPEERRSGAGRSARDQNPRRTSALSVAAEMKSIACSGCARLARDATKFLGDCLCKRCTSVLWTAQTLFEEDYRNELEIIPTTVFGALATEERLLKELKRSLGLAGVGRESERGRVLSNRFRQTFKPYGVWAMAGDVPIIRRDPILIAAIHDRNLEEIEKLTIDVVDVSVRPERVVERYGGPWTYSVWGSASPTRGSSAGK